MCDYANKEKSVNDIYEKALQDKMTDHYLHKYRVIENPFITLN